MFCPQCFDERGPSTKFCVVCGGKLEDRPRELVSRDLAQNLFLIEELERWEKRGDLPSKFAVRLAAPYRQRVQRLEATLAVLEKPAVPVAVAQPAPKFAEVEKPAPVPAPKAEPAPLLPPVAAAPLPVVMPEPKPANELLAEAAPPPKPEPRPEILLASDAVALASSVAEGPLALTEVGAPPPSKLEKIVERESSWNKVWKPFLYDNAIWFVGAFCIVSGSLYVASQAYSRVGDTARSLIVMGMMLIYAAGFGAAGWALGERKKMVSPGRILGLIGSAIAPVALYTLEPLRAHAPGLFFGASTVALAIASALFKLACDRFDRRISVRIAATGAVLMAWELAIPWAAGEVGFAALVPLAALFSATGVLRQRDPAMERATQAFGSLSLLYLAAFDLARLHFSTAAQPGLELYGPVAAALGWIAMRADRDRLGDTSEQPKVPATTLGALALLGVGALASLVAERSAAAAAMICTLAFADAARFYKRAPFVGIAAVVGLFAYYLSPDLIPDGIEFLITHARAALGYAPSQPMPVAYAGISTVPYLIILAVLARRAHGQKLAWVYRPLGWAGVVLTLLLSLVAHSSSTDVRAGLWSSIALVLLVGAALWLAEHAAAGYLFGWIAALLAYDLSRVLAPGMLAVFLAGAGLVLLALARATPERQRSALAGEGLLLALAATAWSLQGSEATAAITFGVAAAVFALLALETHSRVPAFATAASVVASAYFALSHLPDGWRLAPWLLAPAFALLLASGLEWREPEASARGTRLFGIDLPARAEGLDLLRDPLAALATGLALLALFPALRQLLIANAMPLAAHRLALAGAALFAIALARRQAFGPLVFISALLSTVAALQHAPALAMLGLGWAVAAVAFTRWPALARAALRCEGDAAASAPAIAAIALPALVAISFEPRWLVLSALGYLLLMRWRPLAQAWLPLATASLWWASAPLHTDHPGLAEGALALALAALGLCAASRPDWVKRALGASDDVAGTALALVLGLSLTAFATAATYLEPRILTHETARFSLALALFAGAYLLLARQTQHALALFTGWALALLAVSAQFPHAAPTFLLVSSVALALLANLARIAGTLAEPLFGPRPARTIGYAFALLAMAALIGAPSWHWTFLEGGDPSWIHLWPYVAAPVLFLAARALGWAPLHPVALGVLVIEWLRPHESPRVGILLVAAACALALAIATRRWPDLATLVFLDRPPERGRATALRWSMLVGMMVAASGAFAVQVYIDHHQLAAVTAVCAALAAGSAFAAPGAVWWLFAAMIAIAAGIADSPDDRLVPAFAVANALLALSGVLRLRAVDRFVVKLFRATDAQGRGPRTADAYQRALSLLVSLALLSAALALAGEVFEHLDARHAIDAHVSFVALATALTGVHLLWHRRGPWALTLALALPLLPVLYLVPLESVSVALAVSALGYALLAWRLPQRPDSRLLLRIGLGLPVARRKHAAGLAFTFVVAIALAAMAFTELRLEAWQTPATAGLLTVALAIGSLRQRTGRFLALALLPITAHLGLAWLGVKMSTGRPHEAILGAWALACAILAVAAERFAGDREERKDILWASHFYFAFGALELAGAIALMPGMRPGELLFAGVAAALLGTFATLRALRTGNEVYAYLAQAALLALYLLVRVQSDLIGSRSDRDALSSVLLGFAFLGLHALARRVDAEVFDRPTRVMTHVLPLVGLVFLPHLTAEQGAMYGIGLALHYASVSATLGGSKLAAILSGIALNAALAVTWMNRGVNDPQFYAIPFGATLLAFARIFRKDLDETSRFWLRTVGILAVYLASVASTVIYDRPTYVLACALVCVFGVLLGVMLRVRIYVYLGAAVLVLDVLGNMARYGLHQPVLLGVMLTLLGFLLVGGWIYFISKREELLRRYAAIQALMAEWE